MTVLVAFPPIVGPAPRTLILGTMPGGKSLALNQYYAHPQNQFWRLMGDLYGAGLSLPYKDRVEFLKEAGVAVWDVLLSCERIGSMDSDIRDPVVNDFNHFYAAHPTVDRVVFDSLTAEKLYTKYVLPGLTRKMDYKRVPSPSSAYARLRYEEKLAAWRAVLTP